MRETGKKKKKHISSCNGVQAERLQGPPQAWLGGWEKQQYRDGELFCTSVTAGWFQSLLGEGEMDVTLTCDVAGRPLPVSQRLGQSLEMVHSTLWATPA